MIKKIKTICLVTLLILESFVLSISTKAKKRNLVKKSSNTLDFISTLKRTDFDISPQNDLFLNSLAREYKSFALYKEENTNDFNSANKFALKALKAHTGEKVDPINVYKIRLPAISAIRITKLYDDFIFLFDNHLDVKYPILMSEAQAKFDCWIDSETSKNKEQANKCFQRFEKALGYLYDKLEKICNRKCQEKKKNEKERNKFPDKKILTDGSRILVGSNNPLGLKTKKFSTYLNKDVEVVPISTGGFNDKKPNIIKESPFVRPIEKENKTNSFVRNIPMQLKETTNKTTIINKSINDSGIQKSLTRIENLLIQIADKIDNLKNIDKNNLNDVKQKMEELATNLNNQDNTKEEIKNIENKALTLQNEIVALEKKSSIVADDKNISNNKETIEIVEEEQIITSIKNESKNSISDKDENEEEIEGKDTTEEDDDDNDDNDEEENEKTTEEEIITNINRDNIINNKQNLEEENEDTIDTETEEEIEENTTKPQSIFKTIKKEDTVETEVQTATSKLLPYELLFDWNKADVKSKYNNELKTITNNALKSKEMIVIQGHTDASGTPEYNKILSKVRAENVGRIVMSYGIPKNKIIMQGMGDTFPKVPNKKGERKAENRRVVIK